jgi:hypothetical protein
MIAGVSKLSMARTKLSIIAASNAGRMIGNVIRRAVCIFVDPATRADSSSDGSME